MGKAIEEKARKRGSKTKSRSTAFTMPNYNQRENV